MQWLPRKLIHLSFTNCIDISIQFFHFYSDVLRIKLTILITQMIIQIDFKSLLLYNCTVKIKFFTTWSSQYMMYKFLNHAPTTTIHPWNGWIADNATIIGQVELGEKVSIWFGAVVRGDNCKIRIGDYSNIQENAVLHTDDGIELNIGHYVTVGHQATLHGCTIGDNSLIGINAVILNHAVIGKNCIIGANTLVPEGKVIPDNSVVMGSPAKVVKTIDEQGEQRLRQSALSYAEKFNQFKQLQPYQFD